MKQRIASLEANERALLFDMQKKEARVHASVEAARGSGDGLKSLLRQEPPSTTKPITLNTNAKTV